MKKSVYFAMVPVVGVALVLSSSLAASPGHGYVSVAAGSFHPHQSLCEYNNQGNYIETPTACNFYAPVQLPQGATVTKLTAYLLDESYFGGDATARLVRVSNTVTSTLEVVAEVQSLGGPDTLETTTINFNPIDNSQYAYIVKWTLLGDSVDGRNIIIEYTYPTSLPLVLRSFSSGLRGH